VVAQDWKEWSEAGLARLLWRYARLNHQELAPVARLDEWPTAQQEAIASEWCRTLLYRLLVPVLSGVILRGRLMALPLPSLCLHLSSALTTEGVELPEAPLDLQERWPDVGNKMATALGLQAFLEQTLSLCFNGCLALPTAGSACSGAVQPATGSGGYRHRSWSPPWQRCPPRL